MFDAGPIFSVILLFLASLTLGYLVFRWVIGIGRESNSYMTPMAKPMPRPKPTTLSMFCVDCGKALVSMRRQDGFSSKTGEPRFSYERACSDATLNTTDPRCTDWPFCGYRVKQTAIPNAHNHPDQEVLTVTCPTCLDTMVANAGIGRQQAIELYLAAGVMPPADNRALDTDPFGRGRS